MSLVNLFTNDTFFSNFDRLFDEVFAHCTSDQVEARGAPRVLRPRVDVHEDKEKNIVTTTFELPGMSKENVSIDMHNNLLTVSGESKFESDRNENGCVLRERRLGRFSRSVPVPEGVKSEDTKVLMENGVLMVSFPYETAEQVPKKITVS